MEEREVTATNGPLTGGGFAVENYWWWTAASSAQLLLGISSYRKGYAGTCSLMPLRAFFVSSLLLGSGASAVMASLRAYGIHSVEDMKVVGGNIGSGIGVPPRVRKDVG